MHKGSAVCTLLLFLSVHTITVSGAGSYPLLLPASHACFCLRWRRALSPWQPRVHWKPKIWARWASVSGKIPLQSSFFQSHLLNYVCISQCGDVLYNSVSPQIYTPQIISQAIKAPHKDSSSLWHIVLHRFSLLCFLSLLSSFPVHWDDSNINHHWKDKSSFILVILSWCIMNMCSKTTFAVL